MNKEQIRKALECCKDSEKCDVCPYYGSINCQEILIDDIDFFINRQQTEIERLKAENGRFERNMKSVLEIEKENVRKETAKEFAEQVKMAFYVEFDELIPSIMADRIDELVKEYEK